MTEDDYSVEGWLRRSEGKRVVAEKMKDDRENAHEASVATGRAVEFALKSVISKRQRLNEWPENLPDKRDYHSHNHDVLLKLAGIDQADIPKAVLPKLRVVRDCCDRGHDYVQKRMPRKVARQRYEAAFGSDGVVAWLKTL